MDIEPHIEAFAAAGIAGTVEAEHTLSEELDHGTKGYHTAHRNSHLDYSAFHNWRKQGPPVLPEYRMQSLCAYFDHSSYKMPARWGPLNDMQYRSV